MRNKCDFLFGLIFFNFSSDDSSHQNVTKRRQTKQADNAGIEIISLDDDDDNDNGNDNNNDNADRYNMDFEFDSHHYDKNESHSEPNVARDNETKTSSECPAQQQQQQQPNIISSPVPPEAVNANATPNETPSMPIECITSKSNDANNNDPSAVQNATERSAHEQQPSATSPTNTTTPKRRPSTRSSVGGHKRRALQRFQPIQRNLSIEYLSSSDEESEDVNQNKRLKPNQKKNHIVPTRSEVQANVNQTSLNNRQEFCDDNDRNSSQNNNATIKLNAAQHKTIEVSDRNRDDDEIQNQCQNNYNSNEEDDSHSDSDTSSSDLEELIFPDDPIDYMISN